MSIRKGFEKILNTITEEQMRRILLENDSKELFQCNPLLYIKDYRHIEYHQPTYHTVEREDFILFSDDPKLIIPFPELSPEIILLIYEKEISVFDFYNKKEIERIPISIWTNIKKINRHLFIRIFGEYRILSLSFYGGKIISQHVGNLTILPVRNELQPFLTDGCLLGNDIFILNGKFVDKIDTFFKDKRCPTDGMAFSNKEIVSLRDVNNSQFLIYDRNTYKVIIVDFLNRSAGWNGNAKILHEITGVYFLQPLDNYIIARQTFYYKSNQVCHICTEYNGKYFLSTQIACENIEYVSDDIFHASNILYMRTKWNGFTSIGSLLRPREIPVPKIHSLIVSKKERDRIRDKLGECLNISMDLLGMISRYF